MTVAGTDLLCVVLGDGTQDLDAGGAEVGGVVAVVQRVVRRLTMTRGSCAGQPNDGLDVRAWLRSGVLTATTGQIQAAIQSELAREAAISAIAVGVAWVAATGALTLTIGFAVAGTAQALTFVLTSTTMAVLVNGLPASWAAPAAPAAPVSP